MGSKKQKFLMWLLTMVICTVQISGCSLLPLKDTLILAEGDITAVERMSFQDSIEDEYEAELTEREVFSEQSDKTTLGEDATDSIKTESESLESVEKPVEPKTEMVEGIKDFYAPKAVYSGLWFDDSLHHYYKNMPYEIALLADITARQIADTILQDSQYQSDLDRVRAAARIVAEIKEIEDYGMDQYGYYCSPCGVFVVGVYTCAGTTRALGRILDYMGFEWEHACENQYRHQWCILEMDGQIGFADGMAGCAEYGTYYSGITLSNGEVIYFTE